jgi:hypothetical protein
VCIGVALGAMTFCAFGIRALVPFFLRHGNLGVLDWRVDTLSLRLTRRAEKWILLGQSHLTTVPESYAGTRN